MARNAPIRRGLGEADLETVGEFGSESVAVRIRPQRAPCAPSSGQTALGGNSPMVSTIEWTRVRTDEATKTGESPLDRGRDDRRGRRGLRARLVTLDLAADRRSRLASPADDP